MSKIAVADQSRQMSLSLDHFNNAAGVKMNGELRIGSDGKLVKVNAWKIKQLGVFHTKADAVKSAAVRQAFLNALTETLGEDGYAGEYLRDLKARLGLANENDPLAGKPLSRREVKAIVTSVKGFVKDSTHVEWLKEFGGMKKTDRSTYLSAETRTTLEKLAEGDEEVQNQFARLFIQFDAARGDPAMLQSLANKLTHIAEGYRADERLRELVGNVKVAKAGESDTAVKVLVEFLIGGDSSKSEKKPSPYLNLSTVRNDYTYREKLARIAVSAVFSDPDKAKVRPTFIEKKLTMREESERVQEFASAVHDKMLELDGLLSGVIDRSDRKIEEDSRRNPAISPDDRTTMCKFREEVLFSLVKSFSESGKEADAFRTDCSRAEQEILAFISVMGKVPESAEKAEAERIEKFFGNKELFNELLDELTKAQGNTGISIDQDALVRQLGEQAVAVAKKYAKDLGTDNDFGTVMGSALNGFKKSLSEMTKFVNEFRKCLNPESDRCKAALNDYFDDDEPSPSGRIVEIANGRYADNLKKYIVEPLKSKGPLLSPEDLSRRLSDIITNRARIISQAVNFFDKVEEDEALMKEQVYIEFMNEDEKTRQKISVDDKEEAFVTAEMRDALQGFIEGLHEKAREYVANHAWQYSKGDDDNGAFAAFQREQREAVIGEIGRLNQLRKELVSNNKLRKLYDAVKNAIADYNKAMNGATGELERAEMELLSKFKPLGEKTDLDNVLMPKKEDFGMAWRDARDEADRMYGTDLTQDATKIDEDGANRRLNMKPFLANNFVTAQTKTLEKNWKQGSVAYAAGLKKIEDFLSDAKHPFGLTLSHIDMNDELQKALATKVGEMRTAAFSGAKPDEVNKCVDEVVNKVKSAISQKNADALGALASFEWSSIAGSQFSYDTALHLETTNHFLRKCELARKSTENRDADLFLYGCGTLAQKWMKDGSAIHTVDEVRETMWENYNTIVDKVKEFNKSFFQAVIDDDLFQNDPGKSMLRFSDTEMGKVDMEATFGEGSVRNHKAWINFKHSFVKEYMISGGKEDVTKKYSDSVKAFAHEAALEHINNVLAARQRETIDKAKGKLKQDKILDNLTKQVKSPQQLIKSWIATETERLLKPEVDKDGLHKYVTVPDLDKLFATEFAKRITNAKKFSDTVVDTITRHKGRLYDLLKEHQGVKKELESQLDGYRVWRTDAIYKGESALNTEGEITAVIYCCLRRHFKGVPDGPEKSLGDFLKDVKQLDLREGVEGQEILYETAKQMSKDAVNDIRSALDKSAKTSNEIQQLFEGLAQDINKGLSLELGGKTLTGNFGAGKVSAQNVHGAFWGFCDKDIELAHLVARLANAKSLAAADESFARSVLGFGDGIFTFSPAQEPDRQISLSKGKDGSILMNMHLRYQPTRCMMEPDVYEDVDANESFVDLSFECSITNKTNTGIVSALIAKLRGDAKDKYSISVGKAKVEAKIVSSGKA